MSLVNPKKDPTALSRTEEGACPVWFVLEQRSRLLRDNDNVHVFEEICQL